MDAHRPDAPYMRINRKDCFMPGFRTLSLSFLMLAMPLASASAGPSGLASMAQANPAIINVQSTLCDYRGCFGFGPQQWHRPAYIQPNYRPPGATGPTYYQPRAQPRPRLTYDPPPVRSFRPAAPTQNAHVDWCRNQYRTYNPRTDRFVTYEGIYKTCNSPFD
jgi:hypothetical protein